MVNGVARIENGQLVIRVRIEDLDKIVAGGPLGETKAVNDVNELAAAMVRLLTATGEDGLNTVQNLIDTIIQSASDEDQDAQNGFGPVPETPPADPQERFK